MLWVSAPMTFVVSIVIVLCLIGGIYATFRAWQMRRHVDVVCTRCGTRNPRRAKFCAQCGRALEA